MELWNHDVDSLKELLANATKDLHEALLQGKAWNELEEQRKLIGKLSLIIDRKMEGINYMPAEKKQ